MRANNRCSIPISPLVIAWIALAPSAFAQIPVIEPSEALGPGFVGFWSDINNGTIVTGGSDLRVFERTSSDDWVQTARLPTDEDIFVRAAVHGSSVIATSVSTPGPCFLYVLARRHGSWHRVQKLPYCGLALALGARLAAVGDLSPISSVVHVFRKEPDGTLELETTLTGDDGEAFGVDAPVAIANDTVLVGAPFANDGRGAVHVFEEVQGTWRELTTLTPSDPETLQFGASIQTLGHIALINGYVFERVGRNWIEQARLFSSDPSVFGFGSSLVDRHRIVVELSTEAGVTRYLARIGGTDGWTPIARLGPVLSLQGLGEIDIDSTRGFVLSIEEGSRAFVYDVRGWQ